MKAELINTGTELLLGRVLNTHQQWLGRRLGDLGYELLRQSSVPDVGPAIRDAVREALGRADLVVTTGGLGPTSDDLTRDLIAGLLGAPLAVDAEALANIGRFFATRQRPMPEQTAVQARVPAGALVLQNAHGTAPGLILEVPSGRFRSASGPSWIVMLPGPPRELRPMFDDQVVPFLARRAPPAELLASRTLRVAGLGESVVEERVAPGLAPFLAEGLELGYCAHPGEVDVRLAARGPAGAALVERAAAIVLAQLGRQIYAEGDETLEGAVVRRLTALGRRLALAESCTGGCLAHRITNVPGASAVLWAGWVTYDNAAKVQELGVAEALLAEHGAVSEPVARAMADGARARAGVDHALATTGIAGPGGGTPEKSVGTVFIALSGPEGTVVRKFFNPFDRETFKQVTTQQALELLRQTLPAERG